MIAYLDLLSYFCLTVAILQMTFQKCYRSRSRHCNKLVKLLLPVFRVGGPRFLGCAGAGLI